MSIRRRGTALFVCLCAVWSLSRPIAAHVGSPDVFLDGQAGPYRVFVTVRPPYAIPGVADIEILTTASDVREIRIVPLPLTGPGAHLAPVADVAVRSPDDPRLFTGHLWMMSAGAWQVRVTASGDRGHGDLSVPVPTLPSATLAMTRLLRSLLVVLMVLLGAGFVAIVATSAREARLEPGERPGRGDRRRGRIAAIVAAAVVAAVVMLGNRWWMAEASNYDRYVYKPLEVAPVVAPDGRLTMTLRDPGWLRTRRLDDLVRDHDHLMHLFVVSPGLDRFWHLHPNQVATASFEQLLPDIPAGHYELFADLVHATGVAETVLSPLDIAGVHGSPLAGDDSQWPAAGQSTRTNDTTADLGDGYRMVWLRDAQPLRIKQLTTFAFRVEDPQGRPAADLELYMGMPGHAVFMRRDRRVFAHVHPAGSAAMAAMEIGQRSLAESAVPPHDSSHRHGDATFSTVSFPYGVPSAGDYRIFVQVKRAGRILTGAFDARVEALEPGAARR